MEINLLPQDIDKLIRDTILKSALGKNIEQVIDKAVKDAVDGYNSPIKQLVHEVVKDLVKDYLAKDENRKPIEDSICNIVTPSTIETILQVGINKMKESIRDY